MKESYEQRLERVVGDNYQMLHDYLGYPEVQASILEALMTADQAVGGLAVVATVELSNAS